MTIYNIGFSLNISIGILLVFNIGIVVLVNGSAIYRSLKLWKLSRNRKIILKEIRVAVHAERAKNTKDNIVKLEI
jgi:hypothetical protein